MLSETEPRLGQKQRYYRTCREVKVEGGIVVVQPALGFGKSSGS